MSEEVNNPTAGVVESAGTDVETTETEKILKKLRYFI